MKTARDCHCHAIKRARERYQAFFTHKEMEALSLRVRKRDVGCVHLRTESWTRTHWLLDDKYIVVYNKNLKAITTFLPPETIFNYLGR